MLYSWGYPQFSSVQFSLSVVSDSLWPHESQHTRPPCSSPTPGVYPNSCPSSQWCHPAISFSVIPFSSCPQSFPASGSFPMSQLFACGDQSFGVSASASVPELIFRMDWLDLLAVQRTLKSLLQYLGWVKTSPHILRFVCTVNVSPLCKGRGNPVILYPSNLSVFSRDGSKRGDTCNINYTPCFVGTSHSQN